MTVSEVVKESLSRLDAKTISFDIIRVKSDKLSSVYKFKSKDSIKEEYKNLKIVSAVVTDKDSVKILV